MTDYLNKVGDSNSVKIRYIVPTDTEKKTALEAKLEQIEKLFDEKNVAQIIITTAENVYILRKKDDSDELSIYNADGELIKEKTVQDVLEEANKDDVLTKLLNTTELTLQDKIIQITSTTTIEDITQENINSNHETACQARIHKTLNNLLDKATTTAEVAQLQKELEALIAIAPENLTAKDVEINGFTAQEEDTTVQAYANRIIGIKKEGLKDRETKKQAFIAGIPSLTADELSTIATKVSPVNSEKTTITVNDQSYKLTEICTFTEDPAVLALVLIQLLQKNPAKLNRPEAVGLLTNQENRTALSKHLPTNQRIITFTEGKGEKAKTHIILIEREEKGTYKILSTGYEKYKVEIDGEKLEVNGRKAELIVDGYWAHFQRTGMSLELYQQIFADGKITRQEFKTRLNGSDEAYNVWSMGGVISEGDDGITGDDFVDMVAHLDMVSRGLKMDDPTLFKIALRSKRWVYVYTSKTSKKLMGGGKEISASALLAKVGSDNKETATRVICNLLGLTYEKDFKFTAEHVLKPGQVQDFVFTMGFLAQLPPSYFEEGGPLEHYGVDTSKLDSPSQLKDTDQFIAWLKGEAVGGGFDKKEAKTERAKDYTRDYNGKSAQELIEAKQALKKQLVEARIKLQKSINQLKPFIRMDPGTNRPIGKADGTFELTTTTPGLEKANKEVKELRGSTEELQGRIYTVEELLKKANTGDPVLQAQLDIDNENYDKVINNDSLPAYIKAYAALKKANKVLQDEMMSLSLSEKYSSTLERATEKNRAAIEDRIGEEAVQKTKPEREQLIAQAETLISPYFTGDSTLKDSVDSKEQAMVLYIYSQYIIQEAGTDKEKLSDANAKYLTLLRKAKAHLEGLNNYYPLYQTIKTDAERIELLYPDIIDGQLEFQISMGEGIPSRVYTTLDKYISSLEAEITGLETKPTLSAEEKDKLRGYYERLFSLYQAKAEYNKCLELGKKIIDAMESEKIKKESVEDEDGGKSRKGLSQWKEVTKSIKKNLRNRKKILPVKLEDLMSTFYEAEYGKSSADKKNAKQQAIYKTLELITLMKGANNLTPLNKKACSLSPTMTRNEKTKDWPDPKDRFKTFEDAQNYLDDLYKKTIKE